MERKGLNITSVVIACVISLSFSALVGCGGGGSNSIDAASESSGEFSQTGDDSSTQRTFTDEEINVGINGYVPPESVDESVFGMLRDEFLRVLAENPGRFTADAPIGEAGLVTDLAYDSGTGMLTWTYVNLGDYNLSGDVAIADVAEVARYYLASATDGEGDDAYEAWVDGTGDFDITIADVAPIANNYLNEVSEYVILTSESAEGIFSEIGRIDFSDAKVPSQTGFNFPKVFEVPLPVSALQFIAVQPVDSIANAGEMTVPIDLAGPPVINSIFPTSGSEGAIVAFTAEVSGAGPFTYDWDFGGGATPDTSTSLSPTVTLSGAGSYDASLTVASDFGWDTLDFTLNVVVNAMPLQINSVTPTSGAENDFVTFSANVSGTEPLSYAWNFGGGAVPNTSSSRSPSATLGLPNTYDASLTVTNALGGDTFDFTLEVFGYYETENNDTSEQANVLPAIPFPSPTVKGSLGAGDGYAGYDGDFEDWYQFTVTEPTSVSLTIIYDPETVGDDIDLVLYDSNAFDLAWSWGEGGVENITYDLEAGLYYLWCFLWDGLGYSDYELTAYIAGAEPPTITTVSPTSGSLGEVVTFSAVVDGPEPFVYAWNFGGGATPNTSSDATPTVALSGTAGDYDASLTVTNEFGENTYDFTLTVTELGTRGDWWMFGREPKHNRRSPFNGPQSAAFKWQYDLGRGARSSSPAIGADGTIYIGSRNHRLFAINPNGSLRWAYVMSDDESSVSSSPAIGVDGTIYVGSSDTYLYAIDPDGDLVWRYDTGGRVSSSPAIGDDGTIYVGSNDNYLYAINPSGTLKWRYETTWIVHSSPAIGDDGTIYVGCNDSAWDPGYLYAISPSGMFKWRYEIEGGVRPSPAIGDDGTIYVGSHGPTNSLHAINPNGTQKWAYVTGGGVNSSPAIAEDGTIYIGSTDFSLYAVNPNGTLKWEYATGGWVDSSPAVGADGTIYVGSDDYYLYAVNPNGTLKWSYEADGVIWSSPAIAEDGTLYFGTGYGASDDFLYAIGP